MKKIINITLFFYIVSIFLLGTGYSDMPLIISYILLMFFTFSVLLSMLMMEKRFRFNYFLVLYSLFIMVCTASYFYAVDHVYVYDILKRIIPLFIFCFVLYNYINEWKDVRYLLNCYLIIATVASIIAILNYDFSVMSRYTILGSPNVVAVRLIMALFFATFLYFIEENKIVFLSFPIILCVILLTLSVKVIILTICSFSCLFFVYFLRRNSFTGRRKGKSFLIVFLVVAISLIILLQTGFFEYTIKRASYKVQFYFIERDLDLRTDLIKEGLLLFGQRPFLGYGINNFRYYYGQKTGLRTYTHNNFLELLVGVGLLGFFIYYLIYIYSFYLLVKNYFQTGQNIFLFLNIVLICFLFLGLAQQLYWDFSVQLFITVMSSFIFINKKIRNASSINKKVIIPC